MKKILFLFLASLFAFAASACAPTENGGQISTLPPSENEAGPSVETPDGDIPNETPATPVTTVYGVETEVVSLSRGELNIYAKLYRPVGTEGALPAVILSHSAAMTADSLADYAKEFAARGYLACAFDFCGGSTSSRSDGDPESMTIFTEIEDLKAVFAAVSGMDGVDTARIYLFGTSQGGLVSALAAEELGGAVAGLFLLYPAFNIAELAQSYGGSGSELSGVLGNFDFSGLLGSFGFPLPVVGGDFIATLQDFDVYEHIGTFGGGVLILHGSNDFIVGSSYSERAAQRYENCVLHVIEGASHGFNRVNYSFFGDYDDEVWRWIDAFLAED